MSSDNGSVRSRLRHILESAEFLRTSLNGLTFERFTENQTLVLAVLHSVQIVGEASIALPDEIKEARPEIPWRGMRGMRNIIVHQYHRVNLATVWNAIHNHFLPLERDFRALLDSLPED